MKQISILVATALALTLAACGDSDEVAEETTVGTVEVPADEAMTGVGAPVVTNTVPVTAPDTAAQASQPVADVGDATQAAADEAERVADEAAAAADAAVNAD